MKKIMFNDEFYLTDLVKDGTKWQTRRISTRRNHEFRYRICETVAVAESYADIIKIWGIGEFIRHGGKPTASAAHDNKLFAAAEPMPWRIFITDRKMEHLQNISANDCWAEGIGSVYDRTLHRVVFYLPEDKHGRFVGRNFDTPQEAFAVMIDAICGKGTWDSNPLVEVYQFRTVCAYE